MNLSPEINEKLHEMQHIEQNLHAFSAQKQSLQVELNEIENALSEITKTKEEVYKILGGIMLRADKTKLTAELNEKKRSVSLRISSIEKQENIIEEKASRIKKEVTEAMKSSKNN